MTRYTRKLDHLPIVLRCALMLENINNFACCSPKLENVWVTGLTDGYIAVVVAEDLIVNRGRIPRWTYVV